MKVLVIGDTHFDNQYKGQLRAQTLTVLGLVKQSNPDVVVFLGDIFHHRLPDVEVMVEVQRLMRQLELHPGLKRINILRGNHDSADKSDSGLTALLLLEYPGSKINVIDSSEIDYDLGMFFIPHYEDEDTTLYELGFAKNFLVFGHFGYDGCINTGQYFNFKVKREDLKGRTILGHIHRYAEDGQITILGTPWSTSFGECDYPHFVGELTKNEDGSWSELKKIEVDFGFRYYQCPLESLEILKDEIIDVKYHTILRVYVDKFSDENTLDLRNKILKEYGVGYVDIKFKPMLNPKLEQRLSNYDPQVPLDKIDNEIIDKYIEEQATSIPKERLVAGLDKIKEHANKEI